MSFKQHLDAIFLRLLARAILGCNTSLGRSAYCTKTCAVRTVIATSIKADLI